MGEFGELADLDVALYRAVLRSPHATVPAVAATLGCSSDEIDKSVARLAEIGLVRVMPRPARDANRDGGTAGAAAGEPGAADDGDTLIGVSPMLAEAVVLGAEDLELGARWAAVEHRRNTIRALVPDWNDAFTPKSSEGSVDLVVDQGAIGNILMHYADRCERELLSVAPGRGPSTRMDGRTRLANVYSSRRGIKTRALYQHTALRDRATRSYLLDLADTGARIRFSPSVPGRSLVIDRKVALLPVPTEEPGLLGLAIVREPNVIAWVVATFEQLWAEAAPLEDLVNRQPEDETEIDETRATILRLMAEGEKDEAISRRLSISVRTCRRHIADYMAQVGATSRFQAGVIAARAGHTDAPIPQ